MAIPKHIKDNISMPVIGAPLFLISGPDLVIAQCKAGIIGSFPALNARPQHVLEEWIIRIKTELAEYQEQNPDAKVAPFAVNQICHGSNDRLMDDMETCVKHEVPIIITSLRPPAEVVEAAHSYGGLVFHDVISVRHARKAAEQGVDGLILVCAGAGGHAGALSPFALLREVKEWFDGTVILSGSIGDGYSVASSLALGADFAYMGTRFINTKESAASEDYKAMIMKSSAEDIVYTAAVSGVHANFIRASLESVGITEDRWKDTKKIDFGKELNPAEAEAKAWKTIWSAGQGVNIIDNVPSVSEIVKQLRIEFIESIQRQKQLLEKYK